MKEITLIEIEIAKLQFYFKLPWIGFVGTDMVY